MSRRAVFVAAATACVAAAIFLAWRLQAGTADSATRAALTLAAGLRGAIKAAATTTEPYRCGRLQGSEKSRESDQPGARLAVAAGRNWEASGHWLRLEAGESSPMQAPLVVGLVADARGRSEHLDSVRRAFDQRGVELVVALGGLARGQAELTAMLAALAAPAKWPVVAIPGDREAIAAHRAAVSALADRAVLDGARVRLIAAKDIVLATLPGAPHRGRLIAGDRGCVHTASDVADIAAELARAPGLRVLLSHTPPRQRGPGGSDVTREGIHIGEPAVARALASARVHLAIHGLVAAPATRGERAPGDQTVILAAGAADGLADPAAAGSPALALVVTLTPKKPGRIHWQGVQIRENGRNR